MTMPSPRPGRRRTDYQLRVKGSADGLAVPHQRAHVGHARPLGHLCALGTWRDTLGARCGLSRQAALVDLEVDGSKQAYVCRDAVASGEGDEVARDDLIREKVYLLSIADDVAVVRDELVEPPERLSERRSCTKPTERGVSSIDSTVSPGEGEGHIPVRTMPMPMSMLTASSTLPVKALTTALPQRRRTSGLSQKTGGELVQEMTLKTHYSHEPGGGRE